MADMPKAETLVASSHIDPAMKRRVEQAEAAMTPYRATWRLALAFFDHHQYAEINANTARVTELETAEGGSKPRWLQRPIRNRYTTGCIRECGLLAARQPVFEATPRNGDPDTGHSGRMAEQGLDYQYDNLKLDLLCLGQLIVAANCGAAYQWPHWDSEVGELMGGDDNGRAIFAGDIGITKLMPEEVMWEQGYEFDKAPVHIVKRAYQPAQVMARPGYVGPRELKPDAAGSDYEWGNPAGHEQKDLVFVYEWLERPCARYPKGRWISFLRTGEVVQSRRDYPRDPKRSNGAACIHELPWFRRDHRHRPMGVGEQAIDIQRTYNRTIAQIQMWKNLVLNPALLAPYGSLLEDPEGRPGEIVEYRPVAGLAPQWRTVPEIPQSLFQTLDQCLRDFEELFGAWELPDAESAQQYGMAADRDQQRRTLQAKEQARWWSSLGLHLIELMQTHYTEKRLIEFQGRFTVERVQGFLGTKIPAVNLRVAPSSIEARSRASQNAMVWQLMETGMIPFHQGMAAINAGTAQKLIDSYELQIDKQYREIKQMIALGQESAQDLPEPDAVVYQLVTEQGLDMATASQVALEVLQGAVLELGPQVGDEDDDEIHIDVLSQWMVTWDFEQQPDVVKGVARAHLAAHKAAQANAMMETMAATAQRAEAAGADNAARPGPGQGPPEDKPEPSKPALDRQKAGMQ